MAENMQASGVSLEYRLRAGFVLATIRADLGTINSTYRNVGLDFSKGPIQRRLWSSRAQLEYDLSTLRFYLTKNTVKEFMPASPEGYEPFSLIDVVKLGTEVEIAGTTELYAKLVQVQNLADQLLNKDKTNKKTATAKKNQISVWEPGVDLVTDDELRTIFVGLKDPASEELFRSLIRISRIRSSWERILRDISCIAARASQLERSEDYSYSTDTEDLQLGIIETIGKLGSLDLSGYDDKVSIAMSNVIERAHSFLGLCEAKRTGFATQGDNQWIHAKYKEANAADWKILRHAIPDLLESVFSGTPVAENITTVTSYEATTWWRPTKNRKTVKMPGLGLPVPEKSIRGPRR